MLFCIWNVFFSLALRGSVLLFVFSFLEISNTSRDLLSAETQQTGKHGNISENVYLRNQRKVHCPQEYKPQKIVAMLICLSGILLVFSVTPFKIDQIKIQNRSTDQVQNLRNERGGKYAKTLAKIQVRGIFLIRDIRRNILPKFIEICTATPCWRRFAQKQASQIPRTLLKRKSFQVLQGRDPFNQHSDRSDREKRTTSKGGPVFSKLFWLDRTDPLSFGPKFPETSVEWIAPFKYHESRIDSFSDVI